MVSIKSAAFVGVAGAAVVAVIEGVAYGWMQATGQAVSTPELLGPAATGGAASFAVFWIYKSKVDDLEKNKADKAQLDPIHETLREMKDDLKYLTRKAREE